jgi:adenylate kinase
MSLAMRVVFLGPPGCRKGTQAQKLTRHLVVPHVSTGELFRHNINAGRELRPRRNVHGD